MIEKKNSFLSLMKRKDGIQTLLCLSRVIITDKQKHILLITSDKKIIEWICISLKFFRLKMYISLKVLHTCQDGNFPKIFFSFKLEQTLRFFVPAVCFTVHLAFCSPLVCKISVLINRTIYWTTKKYVLCLWFVPWFTFKRTLCPTMKL